MHVRWPNTACTSSITSKHIVSDSRAELPSRGNYHRCDPMPVEDQSAVVELLSSAATHGGAAVERLDTHSAIVFLAGPRAWKLKRAVRFDYLDFSTADRRKQMCEAEVRLNRRTAPELY